MNLPKPIPDRAAPAKPLAPAPVAPVEPTASTAIESLQAQLERCTEDLKKSHEELDAFSHAVSHDLRAPLRAIGGFGRFFHDEYGPTLDDRARGYLERMTSAAEQMNELIDGLLRYTEAGRNELRRRPLDLGELAGQIAGGLQRAAPTRRVEFTCMSNLHANGDERLVRLLLWHLLDNAWKFTGKVAEARVEMGRLEGDGGSFFFIHDNGAGFDVRYAARLFGLFQRLHPASDFAGRGIGLAVAQRIVHRHGGRIWAETRLNEGSTFCFTLPDGLSPARSTMARPAPSGPPVT